MSVLIFGRSGSSPMAAYGDAANLAWLVEEHGIEPHIPVFDKSARRDGTCERADFVFDHEDDSYVCPAGNRLRPRNRNFPQPRSLADADGLIRYRARQQTINWWFLF